MSFEITFLGCGSASPTSIRNPTSQVVQVQDRTFLIDCGEGTQVALRKNKIRIQKIQAIFISHLHGDHYFGLPGLLSTFHLLGREKELNIYASAHLLPILQALFKASNTYLSYRLNFEPLNFKSPALLFEDKRLEVHSFPLKHSIESCGFLIKEKKKARMINRKVVHAYEIPVFELNKIKDGSDFIRDDGLHIKNERLTLDPDASLSYAYCSDTMYHPVVCEFIEGVDLLYHEATFANDCKALAKKTKHSTAEQAALIAKKAAVKQLIIGHYSARYTDLNVLLNEAKSVFVNCLLANDGLKIRL